MVALIAAGVFLTKALRTPRTIDPARHPTRTDPLLSKEFP